MINSKYAIEKSVDTDIKTLFKNAASYTKEVFESYIDEITEERAKREGIDKTVASLIDARVEYQVIEKLLMDHWKLSLVDAREYIRCDMVMIAPWRRFQEYYSRKGILLNGYIIFGR